jgi:hypothetical protein
MTTLTAAMTTEEFWCWNWGTTRSQMCSASFGSVAWYLERASSSVTRPHLHVSTLRAGDLLLGLVLGALV